MARTLMLDLCDSVITTVPLVAAADTPSVAPCLTDNVARLVTDTLRLQCVQSLFKCKFEFLLGGAAMAKF